MIRFNGITTLSRFNHLSLEKPSFSCVHLAQSRQISVEARKKVAKIETKREATVESNDE